MDRLEVEAGDGTEGVACGPEGGAKVRTERSKVDHRNLLRRGWQWQEGKRAWGQGLRLWLRSPRFEHPEDQLVLDDYLLAIEQVETRLAALDAQIERVSQQERYAPVVGALRCFRGIDTLTAMCLVAELHDFMRFDSARGLMAFLGLVPSEHSSGGKESRGEITKAGNRHVRRLMIEAA